MHLKYCVLSRNPVVRLKIQRYSQKIQNQIGLMERFNVCYVNNFVFLASCQIKKLCSSSAGRNE